MGLTSSKKIKSNQPGFPSSFQPGQPGFQGQQQQQPGGGYGAPAGFIQPGYQPQQQGYHPQAQSMYSSQPPSYAQQPGAPQPGYGSPQGGFSVQQQQQQQQPPYQSGFSSPQSLQQQPGVLPLPSQPVSGFSGPLFPQSQYQSAYPVSYSNQVYKPLIPGYASAPPNDQRRSNVLSQEADQNDFSSRYYGDQQVISQIQPQQQQIHKPRKH